jgi:predicted transcriptional regulator
MPWSVTLELDDKTLQTLDRLAASTERSRDDLISQAVQDYLELQSWQMDKIWAGIAAAEQGDFAGEEEIARIVEKYSAPA